MDAESLAQIEHIVTAATDQMRQEMTGIAGGLRFEVSGLRGEVEVKVKGRSFEVGGVRLKTRGLRNEVRGLRPSGRFRLRFVQRLQDLEVSCSTLTLASASLQASNLSHPASTLIPPTSNVLPPSNVQRPFSPAIVVGVAELETMVEAVMRAQGVKPLDEHGLVQAQPSRSRQIGGLPRSD